MKSAVVDLYLCGSRLESTTEIMYSNSLTTISRVEKLLLISMTMATLVGGLLLMISVEHK